MSSAHLRWTVIGAGPAGIATVGRLIDNGIRHDEIAWVDPGFAVGDFGTKWSVVPSNTRVSGFVHFLQASAAFQFHRGPDFAIRELDPRQTCSLAMVTEPLQWITDQLAERVTAVKALATRLELHGRHWEVRTDIATLVSDNVVLAIGSEPRRLDHPDRKSVV